MLKFCQGYGGQQRVSELRAKVSPTIPRTTCEKRSMKLVRLQKDPKYGFGMVVTCGNTYDTVLHGAFVESVHPGGPADKDGNISPGDQIMFVNGTDVQNDHFITVVDLLQYSASPVEIVVAKSNKVSNISNFNEKEKPFTKTKTWICGDEEKVIETSIENSDIKSQNMPIPHPRKKWIDQDSPVNFDVPDLTLNHSSKLSSDQSWKDESNNEINGHRTMDNIPDIIASQMKYESEPVSSSLGKEDISELQSEISENVDDNFLLPGEVFHVVLDKKGGSLGLNIYQGTELIVTEQRHIFIHSVIPNGAADLDGRIKPGDKLLEVNGVLLENLSYQEVVTKLRESPQVAHLVLEKGNLIETESPTLNNSKNIKLPLKSQINEVNANQCSHSAVSNNIGFDSQKKENTNLVPASKSSTDTTVNGGTTYSSLPITISELTSTFHTDKNDLSVLNYSKTANLTSGQSLVDKKSQKSSLDYIKPIYKSAPFKKLFGKLTSFSRTPNLAEKCNEEDIRKESPGSLYRNKSSDCLNSPPFYNPHQGLREIYERLSFNRGSSSNAHPIPTVPIRKKKNLKKLQDIYDYSNSENTFKVSIHKSSRGLGLSICGGTGVSGRDTFSQLIRIRKLYPLQPALECGKLQLGDVILSVNDTNMVGLTNTEALEVLRTTPADVVLEVFRPSKSLIPSYSTFPDGIWPFCDSSSSSASSSLSRTENSYNVDTGEFEVILIKRGGSLGFSISRKETSPEISEEGIYIKALVREPAISDGRIQPGDKIVQVNGVTVSSMSHAEAIEFIRKAPSSVTLKLYRSEPPPTPGYTEKDNQINKPLRWEAVELLNDRMKHKENGDECSNGKRKIKRKLDRFTNALSNASTESSSTSSSSSSGQEHIIEESIKSDLTSDSNVEESFLQRNLRPKSLDVLNSSDRKRLQPYVDEDSFHRQSSVMCTNNDSKLNTANHKNESPAKKGFKNLLKWRGSTLPHSEDDASPDVVPQVNFSISSTSNEQSLASQDSASDDEKPVPFPRTTSRVADWVNTFDVDLDRGWHGRLGFSLCDPPTNEADSPRNLLPNAPEVKAVHPGSLADKDGRIKAGDRLVEANHESFLSKSAPEVIDSLRKTRGLIRMVFCRLEKRM